MPLINKSTEPMELDKQLDPKEEHGEHDQHYVPITLSIIFAAFIVSPLTDCLGPVLELNVKQ